MSKLVGVDIGSTSVRAVEVAGVDVKGYALISRIGSSPLPQGAVVAGRVRSPKDVSVALVRALRAAGLPRHGFILGMTSPDLALTTMVFPATVRASEREAYAAGVDAVRSSEDRSEDTAGSVSSSEYQPSSLGR